MAQHDYQIENQSGANFRADINNALQAIVTTNRGSTEPSATFPSQLWVDSNTDELSIRNASNTDWVPLFPDVEVLYGGLLQKVYPIGSLYFNATDETNPSTLLGFGTWVAFGAGRVPVGFNAAETEFNAAGKTGGSKTHTLSTAEMPAHTHGSRSLTGQIILHGNNLFTNVAAVNGIVTAGALNGQYVASTGTAGANSLGTITVNASHTHDSVGSGDAHNNLQPFITVYIWRRTA